MNIECYFLFRNSLFLSFSFFDFLKFIFFLLHKCYQTKLTSKIDEELRNKSTQYSNITREIASEQRKEGFGLISQIIFVFFLNVLLSPFSFLSHSFHLPFSPSRTNLITKPLYDIIKETDFIESEYLTTLLVVVPKYSFKEWEECYNTLTEFVLPNSSKKLAEDNEFGLFTVTLFKKLVDDYKNACRERRFIIRDYSLEQLKKDKSTDRTSKEKEKEEQKARLLRWCQANFGEAFGAWIHIKVMRVFVESVLRYGLPPDFKYLAIKVCVSLSPFFAFQFFSIITFSSYHFHYSRHRFLLLFSHKQKDFILS